MSHSAQQGLAVQWLSNQRHEPISRIPIGPWKIDADFLGDTGAQTSVITKETAGYLNMKPRRRKMGCAGIDAISAIYKEMPSSKNYFVAPRGKKADPS